VIICEFDTSLVQGDPFTLHFGANTLGLCESSDYPTLLKEAQRGDHFYYQSSYERITPISDRLIFGSVEGVLRLYELVMRHNHFQTGHQIASFKAYLNFVYANGFFSRVGKLRPHIATPGDDFSLIEGQTPIIVSYNPESIRVFTVTGQQRPPLFISITLTRAFELVTACAPGPEGRSRGAKSKGRRPKRVLGGTQRNLKGANR
jgi:hypothetical protein